jgi:hypothetical protein
MLDIEAQYCDAFERQSCSFLPLPCVDMATPQAVCRCIGRRLDACVRADWFRRAMSFPAASPCMRTACIR